MFHIFLFSGSLTWWTVRRMRGSLPQAATCDLWSSLLCFCLFDCGCDLMFIISTERFDFSPPRYKTSPLLMPARSSNLELITDSESLTDLCVWETHRSTAGLLNQLRDETTDKDTQDWTLNINSSCGRFRMRSAHIWIHYVYILMFKAALQHKRPSEVKETETCH